MNRKNYELRNWHFGWRGNSPIVTGILCGHPLYPGGAIAHSSAITDVIRVKDLLEIETEEAVYTACLREHRYDTADIQNALACFFDMEDAICVRIDTDEQVEFKRQDRIDELLETVSMDYAPCILLCLSNEHAGYGDCFLIYEDERPKLYEYRINSGGKSFPTCLALNLFKGFDVGYRISPKELSFYRWRVPAGYEVYLLNTGSLSLHCSGKYCGFDLAPGELRRIREAETID